MLLREKNKDLGVKAFRVISLCNSRKGVLISASFILLNNYRNIIFFINIDIDEVLLLDKNKDLGINSFRVIFLCNSWKGILVSASYYTPTYKVCEGI